MPVITFWSNNEKAIGQTVAAAAAATIMAIEHNYKILLVSTDYNNMTIENCFGAQDSNKKIVNTLIKKPQVNLDSGINGLLKLASSNRVTPEIIHDYTKIVFKNRLEVLYSLMDTKDKKVDEIELEKERKTFQTSMKNIIQNASRYYDYVFVDLKKGLDSIEQKEILESSDVIVNNIEQSYKNIEDFFKIKELEDQSYKLIWNICKYDKNSKYNTKNLSRTILKKQTICETHYNTLVSEAAQEGNLAELLIRFRTLGNDGNDFIFISKIKEMAETILLKYQETRAKGI